MRPETQEDVHPLIMEADEEESIDAMIMRATPNIKVIELCIVDFVDLKVGGQSKLFSGKRDREHFIYEGIIFLHIPMLNTNEAFACLHYRHFINSPCKSVRVSPAGRALASSASPPPQDSRQVHSGRKRQ